MKLGGLGEFPPRKINIYCEFGDILVIIHENDPKFHLLTKIVHFYAEIVLKKKIVDHFTEIVEEGVIQNP